VYVTAGQVAVRLSVVRIDLPGKAAQVFSPRALVWTP
jgi:hypothetical protein